MKIRVKWFAMCREATSCDESELEMARDAGLEEFWEEVIRRYPSLERFRQSSRLAVNQDYVRSPHVLKEGDEVCVIPPVSGG